MESSQHIRHHDNSRKKRRIESDYCSVVPFVDRWKVIVSNWTYFPTISLRWVFVNTRFVLVDRCLCLLHLVDWTGFGVDSAALPSPTIPTWYVEQKIIAWQQRALFRSCLLPRQWIKGVHSLSSFIPPSASLGFVTEKPMTVVINAVGNANTETVRG